MDIENIDNLDVQRVFDKYPRKIRQKLMEIRRLILETSSKTKGVGSIEETLKWSQISYVTYKPKTGTTIRIDEYDQDKQQIALFVHCQTSLVETFRQMYPDTFEYEGNRAVIWDELDDEQKHILKHFIELALTYHQHKK